MIVVEITEKNRESVNTFLRKHWFSTEMVVRGKVYDLRGVAGFAAQDGTEIIGLVTYEICGEACEILSLDSLRGNQGLGSALVNQVELVAKQHGCIRLTLITTNDNLNAMRFYQKRGFDMVHIFRNALEASRKLKPSIPMTGDFGIPLKHEIEFEKPLNQ